MINYVSTVPKNSDVLTVPIIYLKFRLTLIDTSFHAHNIPIYIYLQSFITEKHNIKKTINNSLLSISVFKTVSNMKLLYIELKCFFTSFLVYELKQLPMMRY